MSKFGCGLVNKSDLIFVFQKKLKVYDSIFCFIRINDLRFQKKVITILRKLNIKILFFNGKLFSRILGRGYENLFLGSMLLVTVNTFDSILMFSKVEELQNFSAIVGVTIDKYLLTFLNFNQLMIKILRKFQFWLFYFLIFKYFIFYFRILSSSFVELTVKR